MPADSSNGISFNLLFKNLTDPYRPIELENGYDYFFLENSKGEFSRVISISGTYADFNFYLADLLRVTVTFSEYDDNGNKLFDDEDFIKDFILTFNAIDDNPIILTWNFNARMKL